MTIESNGQPMNLEFEQGFAARAGTTKQPLEQSSRYFTAPASGDWGDHVTVALIVDPAHDTAGDATASRIALDTIQRYFMAHPTSDIVQSSKDAIAEADVEIQRIRASDPDLADIGTRLILAVIAAERLFSATVGDGRIYLVRDGEINTLASDRTWVREAQTNWKVGPGEIHDHPSGAPENYLGKLGGSDPEIWPIEFLWPGDTVLLGTAGIASVLRDELVRDAIADRAPQPAADKIADLAAGLGAGGHIAAIVIHTPAPDGKSAGVPVRRGRPISRTLQGLAIGNLLLLCVALALMTREGGLGQFLSPGPTIEVAKPAFVLPAPNPTQEGDPFAFPPGIPPAGAPSATPLPTYTPYALPAGWSPRVPAPQLPANNHSFGGPNAQVILVWDGPTDLPEDVFYVVTIRKYVGSKLIGESRNWTKSNRIRLDPSFYTAQLEGGRTTGLAAPLSQTQTPVAKFEWSVALYRLTLIQPNGSLDGVPITASGPTMTFLWGPEPKAAPSIYGQQGMETDPFMNEEQVRVASVSLVSEPLSTGLGAVALVLSGIAGWSQIARREQRKRRGQRPGSRRNS